MALLDAANFLREIFGEFSYTAPFVVLLLCGVGLPLPEEVTLIGSGILLYRGEVEFVPIVCTSTNTCGHHLRYSSWRARISGCVAPNQSRFISNR